MDLDYRICSDCETYYREPLRKVGEEPICEDCLQCYYVKCDSCNQYVHEDEITTRSEGPDICDYCLD